MFYKFRYERNGKIYTHLLPNPVNCDIDYEKVAKEGSGRSGNSGTMSLEYLGLATIIKMSWDLMPEEKQYRNLIKILESLPDFFTFIYPSPDGDLTKEIECYNNKWSISIFKIKNNNAYFRGLVTTFTSKDLQEITDLEPILEE